MKKVLVAAAALWVASIGAAAPAPADIDLWYEGDCCFADMEVGFGELGGFCDGPPVNAAGDHYHCEWAPFYDECGWKNVANAWIAPPPGF